MTFLSLSGSLARALATYVAAAALAMPALLPGTAFAANVTPPTVPPRIQAPTGHVPFLLGRANGTQNYTCQFNGSGYAWTLVAPLATLVDDKGKQIMTHYAGPTWQAKDGSKVAASRVDGVTVSSTAIPWLLLKATSMAAGPDGNLLTNTTYIQRVNTTGGLPPTTVCDASSLGAASNVPYTADYYFYKAVGSN